MGSRFRSALFGRNTLWHVYKRLFVAGRLQSAKRVNMSEELGDLPVLSCKATLRGKYSQYFTDGDVAAIRAHNLDFIIRFGFNIIRGEILRTAKYGVWSYHHDDLNKYRGSPACFWELYFGDPVTPV